MIQKIREKPWLVVVAGIVLFLALSIAFVVIAILNPPTMIR